MRCLLLLVLVLAGCTGEPQPSTMSAREIAAEGWLIDWSTGRFYCPQPAPGEAIPQCATLPIPAPLDVAKPVDYRPLAAMLAVAIVGVWASYDRRQAARRATHRAAIARGEPPEPMGPPVWNGWVPRETPAIRRGASRGERWGAAWGRWRSGQRTKPSLRK